MAQNTRDPQGNSVEYAGKPNRVQYGQDQNLVPSDQVPEPVAVAGSSGTSSEVSRSDHEHEGVQLSDANPEPVAAAAAPGTATDASRSDHEHEGAALSDDNPQPVAAAAAPGTATDGSRSDHEHAGVQLSNAVPQDVAVAGSAGTGTSASRDDHEHAGVQLSDANPIVEGVASPGVSALASRSDHVHPLAAGGLSGLGIVSFGRMGIDAVAQIIGVPGVYPVYEGVGKAPNPWPNATVTGAPYITFVTDAINGDYLLVGASGGGKYLLQYMGGWAEVGPGSVAGGWFVAFSVNNINIAPESGGFGFGTSPGIPFDVSHQAVVDLVPGDEIRLELAAWGAGTGNININGEFVMARMEGTSMPSGWGRMGTNSGYLAFNTAVAPAPAFLSGFANTVIGAPILTFVPGAAPLTPDTFVVGAAGAGVYLAQFTGHIYPNLAPAGIRNYYLAFAVNTVAGNTSPPVGEAPPSVEEVAITHQEVLTLAAGDVVAMYLYQVAGIIAAINIGGTFSLHRIG